MILGMCLTGLSGCGKKEEAYRSIVVMEVEGTAKVSREEVGTLDVYQDMKLQSGDSMAVGSDSSVILNLDDDKFVLLEPNTKLQLIAEGTSADSRTTIHLQEGAVVNHLTKKLSDDSSYEVTVPNSTMAVRGTVFRVEVVYDEKEESFTYVTVLEGIVGSRLIFPDGTIQELSEERQVPMGKQVNIRGDELTSEYFPYDLQEIDFDRYSLQALKFLKLCFENGAELSVTEEEVDEMIARRMQGPEEEEPEEEPEEEEPEDSPEPKKTVQLPIEPVVEVPAEEPASSGNTDGQDSSSSGSSSDSSSKTTSKTYTVTFQNGGKTFCTQSVTSGKKAAEPALQPTASGHWDYDFDTPVKADTTVNWVSGS